MVSSRLLVVFSLFLYLSCSDSKDSKGRYKQDNIDDLKQKIILNGNVDAYNQLYLDYMHDSNQTDFLPYSIIMANEHEYPQAFFDVFELLYSTIYYKKESRNYESCVDLNLSCLDLETRSVALSFLKKAIERGNLAASKTLLDYYDKNKHYPIEELYTDKKLMEKAKLNLQNSE
ncbi:MAG: hypothetical protein WCY25_10170 [Moheibacter sp.]